MNRRSLLSLKTDVVKIAKRNQVNQPTRGSLQPFNGTWSFEMAAHLLRRTMYGPSISQINEAVDIGLDACIETLMDSSVLPGEGPQNPGKVTIANEVVEINDPYVKTGEAWVKKINGKWKLAAFPLENEAFVIVQTYRNLTLRSWKTRQILNEGISIYEKMTLFWHNHFGVTGENNGFDFLHNITLLENALGNFRELVRIITNDPAMLLFLNGNENTSSAPNENYARELFELFSIGKGQLSGPGDYSNYTEDDIRAAAKVLTGWTVNYTALRFPVNNKIDLSQGSLTAFNPVNHDTTTKQFSHRFDNQIISSEGSAEYNSLINMIFSKDECARFISRKLYRWFVFYKISDEVEQLIIGPMAQMIIDADYEIKPALVALLKSEHFYDRVSFGQMIKNPYDFITFIFKSFELVDVGISNPYHQFQYYFNITNLFSVLQMTYFNPPSVAGWKAYYQEPLYYRTWINATTLNFRMNIIRNITMTNGDELETRGFGLKVLQLLEEMNGVDNPNILIKDLSDLLFPQSLDPEQNKFLKEILIPGLPDFEWTIEYNAYLKDRDNATLREGIDLKMRQLLNAMFSMPEFYLS